MSRISSVDLARIEQEADAVARGEASALEQLQQRAVTLAFKYLAKRDRTELEVRNHLQAKELDEGAVGFALTELKNLGYVDDARYAERFTEDRRGLDNWGRRRIATKLRKLGVSDQLIERAVSGHGEGEDELSLASRAILGRFRQDPLADEKSRGKALRFLVNKGFDLDLAYEAVRKHERSFRE